MPTAEEAARLTVLEGRFDLLTRDVRQVSTLLKSALAAPPPAPAPSPAVGQDDAGPASDRLAQGSWWKCVDCGSKLGIVDTTGEVRIYYRRELFLRVKSGPGGMLSVQCRHCGHLNEVRDEGGSPPRSG